MLRHLRNLITKPYDNNPVLLGRWSTLDAENVKSRRSILANIDSCGDELCSNPIKLKEKLGYYKHHVNGKPKSIKP